MYLKDPKDGVPSVSLTMTMATWLVALGFCVNTAITTGNIDPLMNLFYATAALYFGRRVQNKLNPSDKESISE